MMKKIFLALFLLNIIPLVNAFGLIVLDNNISIAKSYDNSVLFNVTLLNNDTITYYNISVFETDGISVSSNKISQLSPGERVNFNLIINSNDNFVGELRIKGYYTAPSGHVSEIKNVTITNDGSIFYVTPCDFSIIKGDFINFYNGASYNILNTFFTLAVNQSFLQQYTSQQAISYSWYVGYAWFETCIVTILDDVGLINNPEKDGIINLDLTVVYVSTTISTVLFNNNYIIAPYSTDENVLSITNTGTVSAKNITIAGEWTKNFNKNNFDLEPGKTTAITYTISPEIYRTNQTNLTYVKNLTITGNFITITIPVNIFISYEELSGNYTNSTYFLDWVCSNFPSLCSPKIVYKYIATDNSTSFVPVTNEQWRQYNLDSELMKEDIKTMFNLVKESQVSDTETQNKTANLVEKLTNLFVNENNKRKEESSTLTILFIIFIVVCLIAVLVVIGILRYNKNKREESEKY